MRKAFALLAGLMVAAGVSAQEFNQIPRQWKWIGPHTAAFTYDGTFKGEKDFAVDASTGAVTPGLNAPAKYAAVPLRPKGAVNLTFSPDSTKLAFTRNNDLYVVNIADSTETRLTFDGSDVILNGYASWVYYEEIFGRASRYRAFWWSPDSKKLAFYRFDNSLVPVFPIYSPFAEDYDRSGMGLGFSQRAGASVPLENMSPTGGSVRMTRYPKCGDNNPKVKVGIADIGSGNVTWAFFDENEDQYFGTPFWGADSEALFVSREPRVQNTLDLYSISPADGSGQLVYHETYPTWLDWIEGASFTQDGMYMVRSFETSWQQIYYLDLAGKAAKGKTSKESESVRILTDGPNWRVAIAAVDEKKGTVYFTAERDSRVKQALYSVDSKGNIKAISDTSAHVAMVSVSPDKRYAVASISAFDMPNQIWVYDLHKPSKSYKIADLAGSDYDPAKYALPKIVNMTTSDGLVLPGYIVLPKNFDPSVKYPVHVDIYGGPDSPLVRERWLHPTESSQWWSNNGIIQAVLDCRAAGHNGRVGLDKIYQRLDLQEVKDFVEWADYLKSLPYVDGKRIGVEGFSFGGTMTSLLVMLHPDAYHFGIAGGGVYDWSLYDTHYTERFMNTPANNPEGYAATRVVDRVDSYPVAYSSTAEGVAAKDTVMLKITHGTGDDNVHLQNTLQLVDALHKAGKKFEFMIYPDGLHGYRGYQGRHFEAANREFWLRYLKDN